MEIVEQVVGNDLITIGDPLISLHLDKAKIGIVLGNVSQRIEVSGIVSSMLFVLNESKELQRPGGLDVFLSLQSVLNYIEPIDVLNNEFFLFDTDGYRYELSAASEYSDIVARKSSNAVCKDIVRELLIDYANRAEMVNSSGRSWNDVPTEEIAMMFIVKT